MKAPVRRPVASETDAKRIVLEATRYAREAGFDEAPSRMLATAVSELARNILKYAGRGEIRLRCLEGSRGLGLEIEAVDSGPGIEDIESAMRDHWSSGGSLGLGLPGVERMMNEFSVESEPGEGTRVRAVMWR